MIAPTSFFSDYGCPVRILEEALALRRLGHRVSIVTYRNGRDVDGLAIHRTLPIPWRHDYEVGSSRHKLAFDVLLSLAALRAGLRLRPDVIHGHMHEGALIGAVLARLIGRPLVFDFQGSLSSEMVDHGFVREGGMWYRAVQRLEGWIDRHGASAIVTSSAHAVAHLTDDFGVPAERIRALPDTVDATRFRPGIVGPAERAEALAALGVPAGRRVVVYLGLLARHQGTNLLLHAAARLVAARPDVHVLIMGYPGTEVYNARAEALGVAGHVTFTGRVPYQDAPAHLALGDVAVAPKISATEGSGKLLNYMAMGLPTVTFDTAVNREYLGDGGVYTPLGDVDRFADAIGELLDDPARRAALGARLRQRAEARFDGARAAEVLAAVYEDVLGRAGARTRSHAAGTSGAGRPVAASPSRTAPRGEG